MSKIHIAVIIVSGAIAACSTIGRITVKDYRAESGERVMAGQAEPKSAYDCRQVSKESASSNWGLKAGLFNKAEAIERITVAAVNAAPAKGANYAHVIFPSEFGPPGVNVNAFRDVYVAHYNCENLPAPQP